MAFQGQENETVFVDYVRAGGSSGKLGFIADKNRINVAYSTARYVLYIAGSKTTLERAAGQASTARSAASLLGLVEYLPTFTTEAGNGVGQPIAKILKPKTNRSLILHCARNWEKQAAIV
ncbi:MAG: hypothetical protein M1813_008496 [Trichoglossum hirsutum]|nr:MAG: hypothetical protein M1813_008496 [Trichoglossum hirsutum]